MKTKTMGSVHGPSAGLFFKKKYNGVDDASSTPNISKKKNDASLVSTQNSATVVARKTGSNIVSPKNLIFNSFLTKNT